MELSGVLERMGTTEVRVPGLGAVAMRALADRERDLLRELAEPKRPTAPKTRVNHQRRRVEPDADAPAYRAAKRSFDRTTDCLLLAAMCGFTVEGRGWADVRGDAEAAWALAEGVRGSLSAGQIDALIEAAYELETGRSLSDAEAIGTGETPGN